MEPYTQTNAGLNYDLELRLNPSKQSIHVTGSLTYHAPQSHLERARFYLNHQFSILRLSGKGVSGYQFKPLQEPNTPVSSQASVLDIYFDPPLSHYETVLVQFEYVGSLTEWPVETQNLISQDWTELGRGLAWFPYQYHLAPSLFTFSLRVIAPSPYQINSYGQYAQINDTWYFYWPYPTTDIVVTASPNGKSKVIEGEKNHVIAATFRNDSSAIRELGEQALWILERFSGWFGPTRPTDFTVIESTRTLGGPYARRGLVVFNSLNGRNRGEQTIELFRYLAHEIAHTWWWEVAPGSFEIWLNESFAEFSALLAIREYFGEDAYQQLISQKQALQTDSSLTWKSVEALSDTISQQTALDRLLYDQGPIFLHDLAQRIGYRRFLDFCRARLWSGVTDTHHLLDLLEEIENLETRNWFEKRLQEVMYP